MRTPIATIAALLFVGSELTAQVGAPIPAFENMAIHEIVSESNAVRLEADVRRLVDFGTRQTLSDTLSATRGIGAARRWIEGEFAAISADCGGCLEVLRVSDILPGGSHPRIPVDVEVVNPIAILRGRQHPNRYVLLTGHYDSRVSDSNNATSDAPGANDNASGTAGILEAARLLSRYPSDISIVFAPLAGEEQGLFGGGILADHAIDQGWTVDAVINTDVIGNSVGITGLRESTTVRVFAPGIHPNAESGDIARMLSRGGELDVPSRQIGRRLVRIADTYLPNLEALLIYRLDRFGRGGDHRAFFERGFPAVRVTETHEDYRRQHQDIRTEDGVEYGDLPDTMDFEYLSRVTALTSASLASIAWAPPTPAEVSITGGSRPSTTISWDAVDATDLAGYRVFWRRPTDAEWSNSRWVGNATEFTIENVVIDNHFFGVAAVDRDGNQSLVAFGS